MQKKGVESPRLNAERLMAHVLGLSRVDLYLRFEQPLKQEERNAYKTLLRRRAAHEPLQYILGETEFMSLPFIVTPDVLIPRPETETLVERIIEEMGEKKRIRIIDIGVGSGNIAVSLAKHLPMSEVVAVDTDERVLSLARENALRNDVDGRILFILADVKEDRFVDTVSPLFDVVVSNPPYVSSEEWDALPAEIRDYEPRQALWDGGDGLSYFQIIGEKGRDVLIPGGRIFFEVGDRQSRRVMEILTSLNYRDVTAYRDLNGIERVVMGVLPVR